MFKLRLIRAALIDGARVLPGHVVAVGAAEAADLIRGEAATLVSDRDLPELVRALGLRSGMRRPVGTS